jgi:AraC family transcriptional regulator
MQALSVGAFVRLREIARGLAAHEGFDPLEIEETVCEALEEPAPAHESSGRAHVRDRRVALSVAHELALRFDEPLSLAALAAPHGVSVFALCRAFRQIYGITIHRTLQRRRVRHALALMLDTDWTLAQIAAECGFASHAHLTGLFRREMGVPPSMARGRAAASLLRNDRHPARS